jgi:hypothetical protein
VIKTIVDDEEAFPDYRLPKKPTGAKKQGAEQAHEKSLTAMSLPMRQPSDRHTRSTS